MAIRTGFKHLWEPLLPLLLSGLGIMIILTATRNYGAGISPDSVIYISTARNIQNNLQLIKYDGLPLVSMPPLYPALLAAASFILSTDPAQTAPWANAFLFGAIIYLSVVLLRKFSLPTGPIVLLELLGIAIASPLIKVSVMAWSEPLFVTWVLMFFIGVYWYEKKKSLLSVVYLGFITMLSWLTRYIGVILIFTGIVSILMVEYQSASTSSKPMTDITLGAIKRSLLYLGLSVLPLFAWLGRNYAVSGTLLGPRASSSYPLYQNAALTGYTFILWYLPLLIMLVIYVIGFKPKLGFQNFKAGLKQWSPTFASMVIFAAFYVVFLLISASMVAYDRIEDRLLSPVFVPLSLILVVLTYGLLNLPASCTFRKWQKAFVTSSFLIWVIYMAAISSIWVNDYLLEGGIGFNNKAWKESEIIKYLGRNPEISSQCTVYTNLPDAMYYLAHLPAQYSPSKTRFHSNDVAQPIGDIKASWPPKKPACLVWFDLLNRSFLFQPEELSTVLSLAPVARFKDGTIYTVQTR